MFEGWIALLLKAYGEPGSGLGLRRDGLYYWATGGSEVDFLIERGNDFLAIDVKAKDSLTSRDFKGLRAIAALKGLRRRVLVFLGERPFRTEDGIEALPVREFLNDLESGQLYGTVPWHAAPANARCCPPRRYRAGALISTTATSTNR